MHLPGKCLIPVDGGRVNCIESFNFFFFFFQANRTCLDNNYRVRIVVSNESYVSISKLIKNYDYLQSFVKNNYINLYHVNFSNKVHLYSNV